ncbi:hypothetical protein PM022_19300, partial [Halorubrum ezzemoulense]|nr:hypothetical protein [Halorubrum ezzemoulense]
MGNIHQFAYDSQVDSRVEKPEYWGIEESTDKDSSAKYELKGKRLRSYDPRWGLKKAIYKAFDGEGSQKAYVNGLLNEHRGKDLNHDDVLLNCNRPRIVFRDTAQPTDERSLIATVIPEGWMTHNTVHPTLAYRIEPELEDLKKDPLHDMYEPIFEDEELFAAVGLINSIPFDFLIRTKADKHVVMFKFHESQLPRISED